MSGNDNSNNNPWGKGPRGGGNNPWGSNGGGGRGQGPEQPDLDEMLRKAQENMKNFIPGNMGSGKIIGLTVLVIVTLWLASGFFIVQPGEQAVVQRFGEWTRTQTQEGLGYHLPMPIGKVTLVNVNEIRRMNIGFFERMTRGGSEQRQDIPEESLMLTSDRNIVDLDLVIQWDIKSAEDYLFNIRNQENTIKKVAESAIREAVGQTRMFPIITTERDAVAARAKQIIQSNLDEYNSGVNITQVLIQKAAVHPDVQDAFQDVQAAKQDAEDIQNRARAYREDILPKARGQAIQMLQEAQAYKQSTVARAKGDADRFESVYQAYQTGEDVTKKRIYIETMEEVLQNAQKIILDDNGGQGVVPYLPLDQINRQPQRTSQ